MDEQVIITGVVVDEKNTVPFVEICQQYPKTKHVLIELLEHGLIQHISMPLEQAQLDCTMLQRIEAAMRLRRDLGVNTPGVVLALELLDELEKLRDEMLILQHHLKQE